MAKHVADQVANLVKRLSHHLNRRVSDILMFLFNNKSAGSVGALAGFAIALIFAWKFLNPPGRPPRNPQKRRNAPSTSGSSNIINNVASGSEVCSPSLNIKDSDLIEGTHPPVELTLGQVVRRKLNGSRKVTCQLLGVILQETSPGELQKHAIVRLSAVEVLLEITKHCDLYLMETVHDGESEERVLTALENAGLFKTGGLIKEKVLFCSTENGRSSFVRQLEPDWHIDTNPEIISQLARFIRYQLHISPASSSFSASNVFTSTSLEKYFC